MQCILHFKRSNVLEFSSVLNTATCAMHLRIGQRSFAKMMMMMMIMNGDDDADNDDDDDDDDADDPSVWLLWTTVVGLMIMKMSVLMMIVTM